MAVGVGVDRQAGDVHADGVAEVEAGVVGVDRPHELELRVGGHGLAHHAAHAPRGTEDSNTDRHAATPIVSPPRPDAPVVVGRREIRVAAAGRRARVSGDGVSTNSRAPPTFPRAFRSLSAVPSSLATLVARDLTVSVGPRLAARPASTSRRPRHPAGPRRPQRRRQVHPAAHARRPAPARRRRGPPVARHGHRRLPAPGAEPRARRDRGASSSARRTGVADGRPSSTPPPPPSPTASAGRRRRATPRRSTAGWRSAAPTSTPGPGRCADDLGLPAGLLDRPVGALSGGQAARAQLAALLLARFDVFLLDEPTNDLDFDGLDRLQRFVDGLAGPSSSCRHDRAFLERTVTAVAEIDEHARSLPRIDGGWQAFLDERARARRHAEEAYARLRRPARRPAATGPATQRDWSQQGRQEGEELGRDRQVHPPLPQRPPPRTWRPRPGRPSGRMERLDVVDKPWEGWDLRLEIADAGRSGDVVARLDGAVVDVRRWTAAVPPRAGRRSRSAGATGWPSSGPTARASRRCWTRCSAGCPSPTGERWIGPGVVVGEIGQGRERVRRRCHPARRRSWPRPGSPPQSEARSLLAKFGLGADHVARTAGVAVAGRAHPGHARRPPGAWASTAWCSTSPPTTSTCRPSSSWSRRSTASSGTLLLVTHDRRLLEGVGVTRTVAVADGQVRELVS